MAVGFYFFGSRSQPLAVPHTRADAADEDKTGWLNVTVLPFETVGAGAEQGYLARGISSDLMTDLSRLSGLRLIGESGNTTTATRPVPLAMSSRAACSATARPCGSTFG